MLGRSARRRRHRDPHRPRTCRRRIDRPRRHARRRGPRDARLPAHDVRVGAAARRCSRAAACTIRDGVAVDGLLGRQAPTACRSSPASRTSDGRRSPPTSSVVADGRRVDAARLARGDRRRSGRPRRSRTPGSSTSPASTGCCAGAEPPPRDGPIGGDLGYLKYAIFLGDNRTFSVTLATPHRRRRAARRAARSDAFDATRRACSPPTQAVGRPGDLASRSPPVHVMAGLLNRLRTFVVDGEPLALGFHAVGDASMCTNPLYGRGCSTGFWHAHLLADVLARPSRRPDRAGTGARTRSPRSTCCRGTASSVVQDAEARRIAAALLAGEDIDDPDDPRAFMRSVLREGSLRRCAPIPRCSGRSCARSTCCSPPDTLMQRRRHRRPRAGRVERQREPAARAGARARGGPSCSRRWGSLLSRRRRPRG